MKSLSLAVALSLAASQAAAEAVEPQADAAPDCAPRTSVTQFQDVSAMGRKTSAAKKMTQNHKAMAAKGYEFANLGIYTENGDLEGFFLTYTQAAQPGCR